MTATDELRALLDERGVEHFDGTETTLWGYDPTGEGVGVYRFAADETANGRMQVRMFGLTPAQAVEATLGRERQCRLVDRYGDWYCTNCGETVGTCDSTSELHVDGNTVEHLWRYCPYCGARVIASVVVL